MESLLKFAENRRDDLATNDGDVCDIRYWVGYIDGVRAAMRKAETMQAEIDRLHKENFWGVVVQFDLTYTVKAWTEAERYHFLDFVSSQSTMHRIAQFDLDKQYDEHTDPRIIEIVKELRDRYNETKAPEDYLRLLMSNPCGFKLTAGMTTNYRQLKTIYAQRRNHRLPEWREFCRWIETLPMAALITGREERQCG